MMFPQFCHSTYLVFQKFAVADQDFFFLQVLTFNDDHKNISVICWFMTSQKHLLFTFHLWKLNENSLKNFYVKWAGYIIESIFNIRVISWSDQPGKFNAMFKLTVFSTISWESGKEKSHKIIYESQVKLTKFRWSIFLKELFYILCIC